MMKRQEQQPNQHIHVVNSSVNLKPDMTRKYVYTTLSDEEFEILDTAIEQLGFTSRTDYFTASAHVIISKIKIE